jgi:uncharacterized protein YjiS (DUF1127 family)
MTPHEEVVMAHPSIPARDARIAPGLRQAARSWAANAVIRLMRWHETARERRALLALSDHMLKDIGITRAEAEREASRRFWQGGIDL